MPQDTATEDSALLLPYLDLALLADVSAADLQLQVGQQSKGKSLPLTSPPAHPPHPIPAGRSLLKAPTCLSEAIELQKGLARTFSDHPVPFADPYLPSVSHDCIRSYFNNTPYSRITFGGSFPLTEC